jgi:hypothetical protein
MRDPDLVLRAQRAAAALERAWYRWRLTHGLGADPLPPVSSYVGYSLEEPWGQPRVVFGVDAEEAEQLAALLDSNDFAGRERRAVTGRPSGLQATGPDAPEFREPQSPQEARPLREVRPVREMRQPREPRPGREARAVREAANSGDAAGREALAAAAATAAAEQALTVVAPAVPDPPEVPRTTASAMPAPSSPPAPVQAARTASLAAPAPDEPAGSPGPGEPEDPVVAAFRPGPELASYLDEGPEQDPFIDAIDELAEDQLSSAKHARANRITRGHPMPRLTRPKRPGIGPERDLAVSAAATTLPQVPGRKPDGSERKGLAAMAADAIGWASGERPGQATAKDTAV